MAKKKFKKLLKKAGKAALIAGALYGATRLGRKKPTVSSVGQDAEDINIKSRLVDAASGGTDFPPRPKRKDNFDWRFFAGKKGGRAGKKDGGRTGKQFGGGLNRPVARPVGGVGAPVRPLAYKHGGKVKSMGIAKRGGGVAKR